MSGREYLDFFGRLRGISAGRRRQRIEALAAQFYMGGSLERRLSEYSKGMRQKIALMRTLLHDPPVLLLDEPTSAMDPASARLVRDALLRLREQEKRTIMICTHNLPEAEELSDRIAIIHKGRIVAQGTLPELKLRLLGLPLMELRLAVEPQNGVRELLDRYVAVEATGERWVRYRTSDPATANPALVRALAERGVGVVTLSEVPQSLESVYLRAVKETAAPAAGDVAVAAGG
jgi:ABC-2 type transport system ATP-binding protein